MVRRIVTAALGAPALALFFVALVIACGVLAYRSLDIEAYPNPVPPLVEIITQPDGLSAEDVERLVTVPVEIGLSGMPGLDHVRSQSLFGLSDVKCYFHWGTDYWQARQEVVNRLQFVSLPNGWQARISPWNATGEVFRYILQGKGYSPMDLKTAQDWIVVRQLKQVPGVVDVVSYGGETKEYHADVDPYRLAGQGVTLPEVSAAIANANNNVGGQRVTFGEQSYTVRGVGLLTGLKDIGEIVVRETKGIPVRLRDVADAVVGSRPRLGLVGRDDKPDVVQGIVLMRYGGETEETLKALHERLETIRRYHLLPPGVEIHPYYDRGDLVALTTHTVLENMLTGMGLVTLVLWAFLGNRRAALITAVNIPIALLIAFSGIVASGTSANLISLGAVDFGIVVDSTVIMMENIYRHLGSHGSGTMTERIRAAASEVGSPMAFSTLIIGIAFLPLFTMNGVAGVIFAPMARTYAFAIGGAVVLAITLTPVLAAQLIPADAEEGENRLMRLLHRVYDPLAGLALRWPRTSVALAVLPLLLCVALFPFLGGEFMPKLEEGNLWIRATLPMSVSLEKASSYVGRMRTIVGKYPEVVTVVSQLGRPDDGTDPSGYFNIELFAPLHRFDTWPSGVTKEQLTVDLSQELQDAFPGVVFGFSQMISDNVEEALSGIKGENSVKVIGPDLHLNEENAEGIIGVMRAVRGVADLGMFHSLGQPSVKIVPDRAACARYGLNTGDVEAAIQAAIGGQTVTQVYEGEKFFDLVVRWKQQYRASTAAIGQITVATPDGARIPLAQLATIANEDGPSVIYREDGHRYAPVKFSVRGRDLASTIAEAQAKIAEKVRLPYDTHLEWAGEINELHDALGRLIFVVPLTLLLIGFVVSAAVKNWLDTVIVLASIPIACAGGVMALLATNVNFSVSAAMGFISIFGIAIQDAILVVSYFQQLRQEGFGIEEAAREAAAKRFRPVLMTTLVAMLGLLPAALSHGIGAQTQRPLAIVVIGGALMLAASTRVLRPPLLVVAHQWRERRARRSTLQPVFAREARPVQPIP
ncbi:MAG: efflux RND transporter permease subunit [Deltaproteobacteria bacterium]|nr:efflux RND transporter permease subunit [Deltaproteobacteria bacterium]